MKSYEKLVRDRIPELLDQKGVSYEKRTASGPEYKKRLIDKLLEEAKEFSEDSSPEELADVVEVIMALASLPEYESMELVRKKKREERGAFDHRIILKGEY